jgi:hypothetical protein
MVCILPSFSLDAAELQWRRAGGSSAPAEPTLVAKPRAAVETPEGPARSVVVRRAEPRVAQAPLREFDPFEADDAGLTDEDVTMPATEPPVANSPAEIEPEELKTQANPEYDPFDEPAVQNEPTVQSEPIAEPAIEEAFQEPAATEPESPPSAEQPDQNETSSDPDALQQEVEQGASEELIAPEAMPAEDEPAIEEAFEEPTMEDEIVAPEPPADEELMDDEPGDETGEDLEMQYGIDGQPLPPLTPEQIEARRKQMEQERLEHEQKCEELYEAVRQDSIKRISLDISLQGVAGEDYPYPCTGRHPTFVPRAWASTTYLWKASGLCHKPLYFEQVQLERYGHDWGPVLQPIVSGAHFFGTFPILPYKMGLETPQECVYSLGYYRPGSCAPYMIEPLGFTWRAAAFEAAAWTGGAAAIP